MTTLISAEDTWALWTILSLSAAISIYLEQKYVWANKITGCILATVFTLVLANLNIIPTESPVYDAVWSYVVPLAVPLLLFNANVKKILKESGRMLAIYLLSSAGTLLGGFVAYFSLKNAIPKLNDIIPMFVGTYTGGAVNFVAMSEQYAVPGKTVSAAIVADNLLMALYVFVLISLPSMAIIKKLYKQPYEDALLAQSEEDRDKNKTMAAKFWGAKSISLKDIAFAVGIAFTIVTVSTKLSGVISGFFSGKDAFSQFMGGFFGNKYLLITTITMMIASFFPKQMSSVKGSQEIGTFLIYLFFAVIGAPASILLIIKESPLLLVLALIMVAVNMIISLIFGKIFKFSIEEIIIASNANIGGPTTAAAMAVSKGWTELIIPGLLIGTLGYVIGNYLGIFVGMVLH
jgi:integral membrane protein